MRQRTLWAATLGMVLLCGFSLIVSAAEPDKKAPLKPIVPEDPKLGRPVDFERDLFPILEANCIACHNLAVKENNLNLEDIENILKGGKNGKAVIARDRIKASCIGSPRICKAPRCPLPGNKVEANAFTPGSLESCGSGSSRGPVVAPPDPDLTS
ncbi:MAG: c-type cytochrome domain-containing protein [Planctomycetales bacterium]